MIKRFLERFYVVLIFIFLYAPIVVLMVFSFNDSKLRGQWAGFTLDWYAELINDPIILQSLYNTLLVAIVSTIVSTVIGTLTAIGLNELRGFKKKVILDVNYLPVLNPDIVTAVGLMGLFGFLNLQFGFLTMTLSHIIFCIPYVILSILPKLQQMDKNMIEAAMDLGATPFYAVKNVVIPQIMPAIFTGALMAFTLSIDDFVISYFTTGHGFNNLSITIYSMARKGINPSINAMSTIMFLSLLILLMIINKRSKGTVEALSEEI
ncbi:ABC transporter permease [Peptoniphilus sp.]|uniref:ABC transporter permease n=1 Tax=Peptoniphilus sp. TaxID=1971214 RepID=UPI0039910613